MRFREFRKRAFLSAALAGIVLAAMPVSAATISGYVREEGSRESLPYVSVFLEGLRIGSMTNTQGYYVINGVPPGRHAVVASLVGFNEFRDTVTVAAGDVVQNIILSEEVYEVQTVSVEAARVRTPSLEIVPSRETFRAAELKIAPAAVEADPVRTLQTLPGVVQLSDFNTGLYVRGGTPDQNLILVDGAELYNVSHFFGLFSTFPADAIKSTELLTGGYPAQYGGRLSSVLNVTTDEGNKERIKGIGGISMLSSRLTLQGPNPATNNGSFLISGRRTYLEPVMKAAGMDGLGYYFYDFQGKVHEVFSHNDQGSIAAYLGRDVFTYDEDAFDVRLDWGNWSVSTAWTHLFSPRLVSHYQFNISRFTSHTKFKFEDLGFEDENALFDLDARTDFTWFMSDRSTIETGAHVKRHNMRLSQEMANQRYEAFDIVGWIPAAYAQWSWRPWAFLTLQPGLRAAQFRGYDANVKNYGVATWTDIDPRFTARYQVGDATYLKVSVGRYTQYIFRVPREIQGVSFLSDIWFTSDSSAAPQNAWHYIAGFETKLPRDVDLTIEGYYKDYANLAEFDFHADAPQTADDALLRGDGYAYGLDFGIKKRSGRHMGWISYALSWTVREMEEINLDPVTGDPQPYYPKYDRRHTVDAVYQFEITPRWSFSGRYAYSTGTWLTENLGRYVIEDPIYRHDPTYRGPTNAQQLPHYSRLDLGIRGKFHGWGVTWIPYFQVVNVLSRKNEFARYFDSGDPTTDPPEFGEEKSIPQLPLLPTIGLDLEF